MQEKKETKTTTPEVKTEVKEAVKAVEKAAADTAKAAETKAKAAAQTTAKAAKTATKTVSAKAKKTAKKAVSKKAPQEVKMTVQYHEFEVDLAAVEEKIKAKFVAEGHRAGTIKKLEVYIKPEDNKAYYVINDNAKNHDAVDLF